MTPISQTHGGESAQPLLCAGCGEPEHEPNDECWYMDLSECPYFRRYSGLQPEGSCSFGCQTEPSCITDRPREGWPGEAVLFGGTDA